MSVDSRTRYVHGWLAGAIISTLLFTAHAFAPLGGYDSLTYKIIYWIVVVLAAITICVSLFMLVGRVALVRARHVIMVVLRWPHPVTISEFIIVVTLVTLFLATAPHYVWWRHAGSGGTAPFSSVEVDMLQRIWRPVLARMARHASIIAILSLIATSWALVGAGASLTLLAVRRAVSFSWIGVLLTTAIIVQIALWLLRTIWPLDIPW